MRNLSFSRFGVAFRFFFALPTLPTSALETLPEVEASGELDELERSGVVSQLRQPAPKL